MDENTDGLNALRDILKEINAQDEKIWRRQAREKYLKEEIDKLQTQINEVDTRIQLFETDRAHTCSDEILEFLSVSMNGQIQKLQSQTSIALSLDFEIEQRKKDLVLWQEKYNGVISKFKRAYEERLAFYEETNPAFKECRQLEKSVKLAEFELKDLKTKLDVRKRSKRDFERIRKQIEQANIVNFAESMIEREKHQQIKMKLKEAEEMKKVVLAEMFELQEKLRRRPFQTSQISSGLSLLNKNEGAGSLKIDTTLDIQKMREMFTVRKSTVAERNFQRVQTPHPEKRMKMSSFDQSNNCVILSNDELNPPTTSKLNRPKLAILPPLKSILGNQQNLQKNFLNPPVKSKIIPDTKTGNYSNSKEDIEISINEDLESKETSQVASSAPTNEIDAVNSGGLSSEHLNNLKFMTQLPLERMQMQEPKVSRNEVMEKLPTIPNIPGFKNESKRKLSQIGNVDTMFPPQKKSVNFARPLEIQCGLKQSQENITENLFFCQPNANSNHIQRCSQESNRSGRTSQYIEASTSKYNTPGCTQETNKNEKNAFFFEQNANKYNNSQDISIIDEDLSMSMGSGQLNSPPFNFSGKNFESTGNSTMKPTFSGSFFQAPGPKGPPSFNFSFDAVSKSMKRTLDLFN